MKKKKVISLIVALSLFAQSNLFAITFVNSKKHIAKKVIEEKAKKSHPTPNIINLAVGTGALLTTLSTLIFTTHKMLYTNAANNKNTQSPILEKIKALM